MIKKFIKKYIYILDLPIAVLTLVGYLSTISRKIMHGSDKKMVLTNCIFKKLKYLPITDHYYEPLTFNAIGSKINKTVENKLFKSKDYISFINKIELKKEFVFEYFYGELNANNFSFGNNSFESGDAEVLYYMIRHKKPKRVIEIGGGVSSLIIKSAITKNSIDYCNCSYTIIEPYENDWLENLNVEVIRERVEHLDLKLFQLLEPNDILFIDSSHVVRAQNDVIFEYTEILPSLKDGVIVHIHDIFTPYDYPDEWLNNKRKLWGEQYLLESILMNSGQWRILVPVNWLAKTSDDFKKLIFDEKFENCPGSFWIEKLSEN